MKHWLFHKHMQWQWCIPLLKCLIGLHKWRKTLSIKYCKECGYHRGKI